MYWDTVIVRATESKKERERERARKGERFGILVEDYTYRSLVNFVFTKWLCPT